MFLLLTLHIFQTFIFSVSIVDFEQVSVSWATMEINELLNQRFCKNNNLGTPSAIESP